MAISRDLSLEPTCSLNSLIATRPHWYSVLCCPDFEEKELDTFIEDILSAIADKLDVLSRDNDLRPLNAFVNNIGMSLEPASTNNPFMSKID